MVRILILGDGDGGQLLDGDGTPLIIDEADLALQAAAAQRAQLLDARAWLSGAVALLPRGLAWRRDGEAELVRLCAAIADGLARMYRRLLSLLDEADPRTTRQLLPDWELYAGLPDACAGAGTTVQERQQMVVARLTARGGQTIADLVAAAAAVGYAVTIEESSRFRCGQSQCGQRLGGPIAAHTLRVRVGAAPVRLFRTGVSRCGERLGAIGRARVVECVIRRVAPAHAVVVFDYGGA